MKVQTGARIGEAIGKAIEWGGYGFTLSLPPAIVLDAYLLQRGSLELASLMVSMSFLLGGTLGFWTSLVRSCVDLPVLHDRDARATNP